jgi:hypothetical protein
LWGGNKLTIDRGEFSGRHGHRNLNQELLHPLQVSLANAWDRVFTKHIPKTIEWFSRDSRDILDSFHSNYCVRMELKLNESDMHLLHSQIRIRQEAFKDAVVIFKATVDTLQKEANREFIPVIKRTLAQAYLDCRQVSGKYFFFFGESTEPKSSSRGLIISRTQQWTIH